MSSETRTLEQLQKLYMDEQARVTALNIENTRLAVDLEQANGQVKALEEELDDLKGTSQQPKVGTKDGPAKEDTVGSDVQLPAPVPAPVPAPAGLQTQGSSSEPTLAKPESFQRPTVYPNAHRRRKAKARAADEWSRELHASVRRMVDRGLW